MKNKRLLNHDFNILNVKYIHNFYDDYVNEKSGIPELNEMNEDVERVFEEQKAKYDKMFNVSLKNSNLKINDSLFIANNKQPIESYSAYFLNLCLLIVDNKDSNYDFYSDIGDCISIDKLINKLNKVGTDELHLLVDFRCCFYDVNYDVYYAMLHKFIRASELKKVINKIEEDLNYIYQDDNILNFVAPLNKVDYRAFYQNTMQLFGNVINSSFAFYDEIHCNENENDFNLKVRE